MGGRLRQQAIETNVRVFIIALSHKIAVDGIEHIIFLCAGHTPGKLFLSTDRRSERVAFYCTNVNDFHNVLIIAPVPKPLVPPCAHFNPACGLFHGIDAVHMHERTFRMIGVAPQLRHITGMLFALEVEVVPIFLPLDRSTITVAEP